MAGLLGECRGQRAGAGAPIYSTESPGPETPTTCDGHGSAQPSQVVSKITILSGESTLDQKLGHPGQGP